MIDRQAQALIDLIAERGLPSMQSLSPVEARRFYRDRRALTQPAPPDVAEAKGLSAETPHGAIALRLYRPKRPGEAAAT
ncbi:MAG: alpha/beta hydrolase, partial [Pseudomonadota bacterium]|nr:alpha/beta hydrolase [Pseudomonadota bacterium]